MEVGRKLRRRTLKGIIWSLLASGSEHVIAFLVLVVLARLLAPADFGAVALASACVFLTFLVIHQTFVHPLVQRQAISRVDLDSAFWLAVGLGALMTAALYGSSDLVAKLFGQPIVADLLRWLAPVAVISAARVVPTAWLSRNMRFRAMAVRGAIATTLGGIAGIGLALRGWGVWSLVAQQLVYAVVSTVLFWVICPWHPRLRLSMQASRTILGFGKFVSGYSLAGTVMERIDIVIIGYLLGPAAVGVYNVGHRILRLLLNVICGSIARVLLPAYSHLQARPERLTEAFCESVRLAWLVTLPLFVGLACVAHEAVDVVLGARWLEAVDIVRFLALAGALQSIGYPNTTMVVACGRPDWAFYLRLVQAGINVTAVAIGAQWGIAGVAMGLAVAALIKEPLTLWQVRKAVNVPLLEYGRAMLPAAAGTAAMAATVMLLRLAAGSELSSYAALSLYVVVGASVYVVFLVFAMPAVAHEALELAREALPRQPRRARSAPSS